MAECVETLREKDCCDKFDSGSVVSHGSSYSRGSSLRSSVGSSKDWQVGLSIQDCLLYILKEGKFHDVTFVFPQEGPEICIQAHKLLLAIRSPYMEALFYGMLANKKGEIEITNYSSAPFREFLSYIYSDHLDINASNANELMLISHEYCMPDLTQLCADYISKNLEPDIVLEALDAAKLLEMADLELKCLLYIDSHAKAVFEVTDFPDLNDKTVIRIFQRDTLSVDEISVYRAAVRWAEAECNRNGLEDTPSHRRQVLGRIFKFVRMSLVTKEQIADIVVKDKLLTNEELIEVFTSLCSTSAVKPKLEAFPFQTKRQSALEMMVCFEFEEEPFLLANLDEDLSITVTENSVLLGFIVTQIISNETNQPLEVIEGSVTMINDGDEPFASQLNNIPETSSDGHLHIKLEDPLILLKNKQYHLILSALGTIYSESMSTLPYKERRPFKTYRGKLPVVVSKVGLTTFHLIQHGEKRTKLSPLVGLLVVT